MQDLYQIFAKVENRLNVVLGIVLAVASSLVINSRRLVTDQELRPLPSSCFHDLPVRRSFSEDGPATA